MRKPSSIARLGRAWRCLAVCIVGAAADGCADVYKAVLKRPSGAVIRPKEVGGLYSKWCKKNMKVSSAKSMDELCAPLVRKIEEKMRWVPADEDVTPEMACASVEKLKEQFPAQVEAAEAQLKLAAAEEKKHKDIVDKAKELKSKLASELKEVLGASTKDLLASIGVGARGKAEEVLGGSLGAPGEAMVKQLEDAAQLASRGVETKLLQKLDEVVGNWASAARKEAKAKAAQAEL
mmetsp:Transcript_14632/g.29699  ORF Transcript_14632/g.29699 Transcript_14632/m.29699 type:complete len:235 (-) Transcript_14632:305-1009(-)